MYETSLTKSCLWFTKDSSVFIDLNESLNASLYVCALWLAGDRSQVYFASRPQSSGTAATLMWKKHYRKWMDRLYSEEVVSMFDSSRDVLAWVCILCWFSPSSLAHSRMMHAVIYYSTGKQIQIQMCRKFRHDVQLLTWSLKDWKFWLLGFPDVWFNGIEIWSRLTIKFC